nr:hypothetical protein [Tanacetum cinerariifolium]
TYTSVYIDCKPGIVFWGADEELSDGALQDEHELMFIQPHDPDFVPEPIYPEYIPLEDEHILLAEEQPLSLVASPTAESPGYVAESNPEEDPEEYEDDEAKDGQVDYPWMEDMMEMMMMMEIHQGMMLMMRMRTMRTRRRKRST